MKLAVPVSPGLCGRADPCPRCLRPDGMGCMLLTPGGLIGLGGHGGPAWANGRQRTSKDKRRFEGGASAENGWERCWTGVICKRVRGTRAESEAFSILAPLWREHWSLRSVRGWHSRSGAVCVGAWQTTRPHDDRGGCGERGRAEEKAGVERSWSFCRLSVLSPSLFPFRY